MVVEKPATQSSNPSMLGSSDKGTTIVLGDSKSDILTSRLVMPIAFYLLLLLYAFISSYYGESTTPIYLMLIFMMSSLIINLLVMEC